MTPAPTSRSTERLSDLLAPMQGLDWTDEQIVDARCSAVLGSLASDIGLLKACLAELPTRERLISLSDHDIPYRFTKFVLHDDGRARYRLRFHVMHPGTPELAHSHRSSFAARILVGGYEHVIYTGSESEHLGAEAGRLEVGFRGHVREGDYYFMNHRVVHTLRVADSPCLSLVLRGPAQKDGALVIDNTDGRRWRQLSAAAEGDEAERLRALFRPVDQHDIDLALALLEGRAS